MSSVLGDGLLPGQLKAPVTGLPERMEAGGQFSSGSGAHLPGPAPDPGLPEQLRSCYDGW